MGQMDIEALERELRTGMDNAAMAIRIADQSMKKALKNLKELEEKRPNLRIVK